MPHPDGPQQHHVVAVVDLEVDILHGHNFAELLGHLLQLQPTAGAAVPSSTACSVTSGGLRVRPPVAAIWSLLANSISYAEMKLFHWVPM